MRTILLLGAAAVLVWASGCKSSEPADKGPTTKVTKANIEKAKEGLKLPMPVADAKKQIGDVLGEPTAKDGDNLIWAGVSGDECHELKLIVSNGSATGTIGGMANKIVADEFKKCETHAGK